MSETAREFLVRYRTMSAHAFGAAEQEEADKFLITALRRELITALQDVVFDAATNREVSEAHLINKHTIRAAIKVLAKADR